MSLHTIGNTDFSYDTAIRAVLPDGRTIGNNTRYSRTTTCHQRMREVENCDIVLDNVPQGTTDLAGIARERGLIKPITATVSLCELLDLRGILSRAEGADSEVAMQSRIGDALDTVDELIARYKGGQ